MVINKLGANLCDKMKQIMSYSRYLDLIVNLNLICLVHSANGVVLVLRGNFLWLNLKRDKDNLRITMLSTQ